MSKTKLNKDELRHPKSSLLSRISSRLSLRYIVKRLVERFLLVFAIVNFLFFLFWIFTLYIAHLNPAELYIPLDYKNANRASEIAGLDRQFGFDRPLYVQYVDYVRSMLTFHFGYSLIYDESITQLIISHLPIDLLILVPSLILSTLLAVFLGLFSALRYGKLSDVVNSNAAIITYFIPAFWVFTIVLDYLGFTLGIFPTNIVEALTAPNGEPLKGFAYVAGLLKFSALPIILLTLLSYGVRMILTKASAVEVMSSHFVTYLRARGIPESRVVFRHVMRNSIIPALTRMGVDFAFIITGSVFVEEIFNFQGIGYLLLDAAESLNIPVLGAAFFIITLYIVVVLFLLDLVYPFIDPRVKYD
ncbi:ABC transporter permease [Sulfuracidifex tepidarius]|uniref:ABC transmembrane type-1 domain-containing protein n=2 Tax=Sulfuracidifex tepidarius TaxID=1294262 RepID=A0A510DTQ6_9CREN|nr:ABC transporter permease [Sulfuracidifex tepidarius]BBG23438.1 hypothetical protein IC006_0722 [Sulfuracidifex tepidarius]BBG26190.1 hypothetical protein IC007_0695 [Sulfuracidifex tepidarius]